LSQVVMQRSSSGPKRMRARPASRTHTADAVATAASGGRGNWRSGAPLMARLL
jgi:hypothetical protein